MSFTTRIGLNVFVHPCLSRHISELLSTSPINGVDRCIPECRKFPVDLGPLHTKHQSRTTKPAVHHFAFVSPVIDQLTGVLFLPIFFNMASLEGPSEVPLGKYIFERIRNLGIEHIFGVPGDFNLNLLDHLSSSNLQWVGTCNELNAAYAADGYARIRGLPGVLITTYGVGELSAIDRSIQMADTNCEI